MFANPNPVFFRILRIAYTGPIPIIEGSQPITSHATIRANGVKWSALIEPSFATITDDAPSQIPLKDLNRQQPLEN